MTTDQLAELADAIRHNDIPRLLSINGREINRLNKIVEAGDRMVSAINEMAADKAIYIKARWALAAYARDAYLALRQQGKDAT